LNSVSKAVTERWKIAKTKPKTIAHDHSYHVASARTIQRNTYHQGWKAGRRIVDLGILAEGLRCCKSCGKENMSMDNIIKETKFGLGGLLHILCKNCAAVNKVALGKRHGIANQDHQKVWDINSKAAIGRNTLDIRS